MGQLVRRIYEDSSVSRWNLWSRERVNQSYDGGSEQVICESLDIKYIRPASASVITVNGVEYVAYWEYMIFERVPWEYTSRRNKWQN